MTPGEFLWAKMQYCTTLGASETSGYRTEKHNDAQPGSVKHSAHRFWLAVDLTYDAPPNPQEAKDIAARLGLLLIHEVDHDHLQPLTWPPG